MTLLQVLALVKKLYPIFKELGVRVRNNVAKARIKIARKRTDIKKDQRPMENHVSGFRENPGFGVGNPGFGVENPGFGVEARIWGIENFRS